MEFPVHTIASYDGSYQQRSGKSGGRFSRYRFAAAISITTGKVLFYGIACYSCNQFADRPQYRVDGLVYIYMYYIKTQLLCVCVCVCVCVFVCLFVRIVLKRWRNKNRTYN